MSNSHMSGAPDIVRVWRKHSYSESRLVMRASSRVQKQLPVELLCEKSSTKTVTCTSSWPPHAAKNQFISHGFSTPGNWRQALYTLVRVDNETANVYSALIGFIPMLILLCNAWAIRSSNWNPIGVSIGILLFCVNIAMTSAYHTFCQVPGLYTIWTALDYVGINFALCSISFTMSYYGFQLINSWMWYQEFAILALLAFSACIIASGYLLLTDHDPFVIQAINVLISVFIFPTCAKTMPDSMRNLAFYLLVVVGAILHVFKIPERWFPCGFFDILGHSHCLWHLSYTFGFYCFFSSMIAMQTDTSMLWDVSLFKTISNSWITE